MQVLVTGGNGFLGSHIILQLANKGFDVRTTLRNRDAEQNLRAALLRSGLSADRLDAIQCVEADLCNDAGWDAAVQGCDYVLHVASPFPPVPPKDAQRLIGPAVQGTERVLRAARQAGVRRVVLTSSMAAVSYGHQPTDRLFDEKDWTDLSGRGANAYTRSKTMAERAAWDFVIREGGGLELAVINPDGIFGPLMLANSASTLTVKLMLDGKIPAHPRLWIGVVDVRDVADLHLRAMAHPNAAGKRFIAVSGEPMRLAEIASMLNDREPARVAAVSTKEVPDWILRCMAPFNRSLRQIVPELGKVKRASSAEARTLLDWQPRDAREAIFATADSLEQLGLLQERR